MVNEFVSCKMSCNICSVRVDMPTLHPHTHKEAADGNKSYCFAGRCDLDQSHLLSLRKASRLWRRLVPLDQVARLWGTGMVECCNLHLPRFLDSTRQHTRTGSRFDLCDSRDTEATICRYPPAEVHMDPTTTGFSIRKMVETGQFSGSVWSV